MATAIQARARARSWLRAFVDAYQEHDLLTYASAISFQVLSAIVPLLLFAFGVLGYLHLEDVWRTELGPDIEPNVSRAAFAMMDEVVETALVSRQGFWVTAASSIALWEISGAVRAVMGALNRIYRDPTERSWGRRMGVSFALGLAVGACFLAAAAVVVLTPLFERRRPALTAARARALGGGRARCSCSPPPLLLHYAPERHQPLHWVTFGSLLIMAGWVVMSAGFAVYPARHRVLQLDLREPRHGRRADRLPVRLGRGVPRRRPGGRADT